jgi:hypothetical protein
VKIRWKRGQAIVAILVVMLMLVTAACGNGDDDDDAETSTAASTATTASSDAAASPTEADEEDEATSTSAQATATEAEEEDEPTPTTAAQATATESDESTATTASGDPTATEAEGEETAGTGEVEVPEFETLDPELLPNFSLTMDFNATNFSGAPQTSLQMMMQQSAIGSYHFQMNADGQPIEIWTVGDQSWAAVGGEVVESPSGPLFDPADILQTGGLIPEGLNASRDGTEEINGRQTTRWFVDGADYVAFMNEEAQADPAVTVDMTNGAGDVYVWIDDELNIMILAEADVTWDNSDGTAGSLVYDYEIHDIGTTAEVVAPV